MEKGICTVRGLRCKFSWIQGEGSVDIGKSYGINNFEGMIQFPVRKQDFARAGTLS